MNKTQIESLERIIESNSKWMEANAENPEALAKYPSVAASTIWAVMILEEKQKETDGDAAVSDAPQSINNLATICGLIADQVVALSEENKILFANGHVDEARENLEITCKAADVLIRAKSHF